jgi:ADP-ribose pyrophosphatase YjhB (NUDIX family)
VKNYVQKIRRKLGHHSFIHPVARIIIENEKNQILIIERTDIGKIGIPAGSLEEGETIGECILREVAEETGLKLKHIEVIGISSNPDNESVVYPNGDKIQYFTIEFYSNTWEEEIMVQDTAEVKSAKFVDLSMLCELPKNEQSALVSLHYFRAHRRIRLT